jgi:hypothetical protein
MDNGVLVVLRAEPTRNQPTLTASISPAGELFTVTFVPGLNVASRKSTVRRRWF